MNKEEKEAIEYFRKRILKTKVEYLTYIDSKKVRTLLNYIDKLQNEVEYEKELRLRYERRYDICKEDKDKLKKRNKELIEANDKLKATKRIRTAELVDKLQKENDFLKAPFEYANGNTLDKRYVEMNFISKDKIREKIKELEDKKEQYSEQPLIYNILKNQLEELLGE